MLCLAIFCIFLCSFQLSKPRIIVHKLTGEFTASGNDPRKIPPRPNFTHTLTAMPDPFETGDPTTQAKVVLRRDLFSNKNGEVLYYALLVSLKEYHELPINGTWNGTWWPDIPNWEQENTSFQVTPRLWDPFKGYLSIASYILGDGSCDDRDYYCNKPLKKKTRYALKIRAFTDTGYQDTDVIYFETLDNLPLSEIVPILGGLILVTAAAVCLSVFDFEWVKGFRKFPGGTHKEYFSPGPVALSHKSFLKYAEELLNIPGRLGNEFHLLGTLSSDLSTLCLHAQRVDNRNKNRYGNILPFDMTRVKLSIIDDDPSTDYINASFIKGCKQEVEYIAAQGPKEETCHDFYRMIIEQNIELVVMLTELSENGAEKCFKYYPDEGKILKINDIMISCKHVDELDVYTKRVLTIAKAGKSFMVTQLHFRKWRDFECPDGPEVMLKFCDLVHKNQRKGCTLVHCSAGAGRSGTYIAIDMLLQDVKNNNKINVFNTVLKLRQQRINMVQTEAQLGYIYKCISHAIDRSLQEGRKSFEMFFPSV